MRVFARVTTFTGTPAQIDAALAAFRDAVLPWLRDASGYRGWMALNDRDRGRSLGVTFWASAEQAQDTEESGGTLRDELAATVGMQKQSVEIYEVELFDPLSLGADDGD